jgi:enoyl-CoA hydratase
MSTEKSTTRVVCSHDGSSAHVHFVTEGGVNVFSSRVLQELFAVVARLAEDRGTRFVAFRGEGKIFVAGADISEMSPFSEAEGRAFAELGHKVMDAIASLPQVTFALLNGHALGGGCELALACDFRLAAAAARLAQPECKLGLIPGWGGTLRLPRVVGAPRARRLLLTGEQLTAEAASAIGLVDEVAPTPDELEASFGRWRAALQGASPMAIGRIKAALRTGDEIGEFAGCFGESEAHEGLAAFLEKRTPAWVSAT